MRDLRFAEKGAPAVLDAVQSFDQNCCHTFNRNVTTPVWRKHTHMHSVSPRGPEGGAGARAQAGVCRI